MRKLLIAGIALVILTVALVIYVWPRGVKVVVANRGTSAMTSVSVLVTGGSFGMADVPAGESRSVYVKAAADSHITLTYTDAAGPRNVVVDCYFGKGYQGSISIDVANGAVTKLKDDIRVGPL